MKLELDLDTHAERLRTYETTALLLQNAKTRLATLERESYAARTTVEDAQKKHDVAVLALAGAFAKEALPILNAPREAAPAEPSGGSDAPR